MPKTKRNTSSKNMKKNIMTLLNSVNSLYIISALALIHIIGLIMSNDNKTLFLFMILSVIVYLYNTNMIYVLGIPLVFTGMILLLNKMLMVNQTHEGFIDRDMDYKQINHEQLKEIVLEFLNDPDNEEDYTNYTENIRKAGNIADLADNLSSSQSKTKENVNKLIKYLIEINEISEDDEMFNNEQVVYSKKLLEHLLDNSDKILKDQKDNTNKNKVKEDKVTTKSEHKSGEDDVENIKEAVTGLLEALNKSK
jgi:hypothetical protein